MIQVAAPGGKACQLALRSVRRRQGRYGLVVKEGAVSPGVALQKELNGKAEIGATLICGDNYFFQDPEKGGEEGLKLIELYQPDI